MLRALAGVFTAAYGLCALTVFSLIFLLAAVLALVVPRLDWRRAVIHRLARLALPVLGVRLEVDGLDRLPDGSCVVVANHASYLDGVVMKAALPPRFSFVIKREAASMPVAGLLLRRIGSEFVDRHDAAGGAAMPCACSAGGTGTRARVLPRRHLRLHARLKALSRRRLRRRRARRDAHRPRRDPRRRRRAMPNRALLVRPGRVRVEILEPLASSARRNPVRAGDAPESRRRMLARLDEPDLAPEQTRGH